MKYVCMYQMLYYEAVVISATDEKVIIPQSIGKAAKQCTFFTEIPPSLQIAQPERADFRLTVEV